MADRTLNERRISPLPNVRSRCAGLPLFLLRYLGDFSFQILFQVNATRHLPDFLLRRGPAIKASAGAGARAGRSHAHARLHPRTRDIGRDVPGLLTRFYRLRLLSPPSGLRSERIVSIAHRPIQRYFKRGAEEVPDAKGK